MKITDLKLTPFLGANTVPINTNPKEVLFQWVDLDTGRSYIATLENMIASQIERMTSNENKK